MGMTPEEKLLYQKIQITQSSGLPDDLKLNLYQQASNEFQADVQDKINKEKLTKAMGVGAIVGGITGGDERAIVGAMIAKENAKK